MFHFRENYLRYGPQPTTHDLLKFLAILIMVIDHVGHFFFHDALLWRAVGRTCVPMWFFLVGYSPPSKTDREFYILAGALVAIKILAFQPVFPLNILFSIAAARIFIDVLNRHEFKKWQSFYYILGLAIWLPTLFVVEYGTVGMMFALFGYLVRTQPGSDDTKLAAVLASIVFVFMENVNYGFSFFQNLVMWAGTGGVMYCLYHFRRGYLALPSSIPPKLREAGIFLARNSLYFYVLHLTLFILIERLIHPELHMNFKWI